MVRKDQRRAATEVPHLRCSHTQPTNYHGYALAETLGNPHAGISGASYYEGTFSNVQRGPKGDYVAVSSRGNFFLTWSPGETYWQPHNRPTCGPRKAPDLTLRP